MNAPKNPPAEIAVGMRVAVYGGLFDSGYGVVERMTPTQIVVKMRGVFATGRRFRKDTLREIGDVWSHLRDADDPEVRRLVALHRATNFYGNAQSELSAWQRAVTATNNNRYSRPTADQLDELGLLLTGLAIRAKRHAEALRNAEGTS